MHATHFLSHSLIFHLNDMCSLCCLFMVSCPLVNVLIAIKREVVRVLGEYARVGACVFVGVFVGVCL